MIVCGLGSFFSLGYHCTRYFCASGYHCLRGQSCTVGKSLFLD